MVRQGWAYTHTRTYTPAYDMAGVYVTVTGQGCMHIPIKLFMQVGIDVYIYIHIYLHIYVI